MPIDPEDLAHAHVEATRRVIRRAAELCVKRGGGAVPDVAIGVAYAAFDVAEQHVGEGMAAIDWLRDALDLMERGILDGAPRAKPSEV